MPRRNSQGEPVPEAKRVRAGRRVHRESCLDPEYTEEETTFLRSIEEYKRENRRPFPSWTEILDVIHALGYRKVAPAVPLPRPVKPPST